jgi:hypothetical protein
MDTDFLIYQKKMELWQLLYSDWLSGLTTVKYWAMVAVIVLAYIVWYKLTDKTRLADLLLYGSFLAVMRVIIDMLGSGAGLWYYKDHILPITPSPFLHVLTLTPLTYMLVQQYSSNWRQFFLWNAVGTGLVEVMLKLLGTLGYLQSMRWNYAYGFIVMYVAATLARAAFHLVIQVQEKAREGKPSPLQSTLMQPAFKPLPNKDKNSDSDDDTRQTP